MVVDFVKCPICHETINTFYISGKVCPACKGRFSSTAVANSRCSINELKEERKKYREETMTKAQIKKMFNLSNDEISKIPCSNRYDQKRYKKIDVARFLKQGKPTTIGYTREDMSFEKEKELLYERAKSVALDGGKMSSARLQYIFQIDYPTARMIMDMLLERKIIKPADGAKPYKVIKTAKLL